MTNIDTAAASTQVTLSASGRRIAYEWAERVAGFARTLPDGFHLNLGFDPHSPLWGEIKIDVVYLWPVLPWDLRRDMLRSLWIEAELRAETDALIASARNGGLTDVGASRLRVVTEVYNQLGEALRADAAAERDLD